jgi:hypothetical protein
MQYTFSWGIWIIEAICLSSLKEVRILAFVESIAAYLDI